MRTYLQGLGLESDGLPLGYDLGTDGEIIGFVNKQGGGQAVPGTNFDMPATVWCSCSSSTTTAPSSSRSTTSSTIRAGQGREHLQIDFGAVLQAPTSTATASGWTARCWSTSPTTCRYCRVLTNTARSTRTTSRTSSRWAPARRMATPTVRSPRSGRQRSGCGLHLRHAGVAGQFRRGRKRNLLVHLGRRHSLRADLAWPDLARRSALLRPARRHALCIRQQGPAGHQLRPAIR